MSGKLAALVAAQLGVFAIASTILYSQTGTGADALSLTATEPGSGKISAAKAKTAIKPAVKVKSAVNQAVDAKTAWRDYPPVEGQPMSDAELLASMTGSPEITGSITPAKPQPAEPLATTQEKSQPVHVAALQPAGKIVKKAKIVKKRRVRKRRRTRYVRVRRGDTLWKIARRHYGNGMRYRKIQRLNRSRVGRTGRRLRPGMRLALPRR